ncbi:MAG: hypothetical protein ABI874_10390 [Chloroflexota bacterium]
MTTLRRFRRPLAWLVALVALAFLARVLLDSASELQRYPLTFDPLTLAVAFIALVVTLFCAVPLWQWSLCWLGAPLSFTVAARIWFLSNFVRYVPGNIWQPVTMVVLAKARGVDEVRTATSVALNWILSNVSALVVAGMYWALDPSSPTRERLWALPLIVGVTLAVLHPAVFGRALRFALRVTGGAETNISLSFTRLLSLLLLHGVTWIFYGVSFAIFWSAFYPLDGRDVPRLTGAFAGAYAIGFLSLLTPSGLGVREAALVFFLNSAYPVAVVTVIALLSRVWLISGELLCTGITLVITRGRHA